MNKKLTAEQFISQLYRGSSLVSLADFPIWALNLLKQVIPFDAAIWGTGHVTTQAFHTKSAIGVSEDIFIKLKETLTVNPILEQLLLTKGLAVDMRDVFNDDDFFQSTLYQHCFKPFDITRILSSIHEDEDSGIFTLLTLYRFERQNTFTKKEKEKQSRLLYHLLCAASHRALLALQESSKNIHKEKNDSANAICDKHGLYHSVSPYFIKTLSKHLPELAKQKLPFSIQKLYQSPNSTMLQKDEDDELVVKDFSIDNLQFSVCQHGDLYRVSIRIKNQLDALTKREKQVVTGICKGGTFKQIARELSLSPSTISNHLYRIYHKLDIHTRSELVTIANNTNF